MTKPFSLGLTRATQLTKAGNLREATALIQSLLNGSDQTAQPVEPGNVIEGEFTRLDSSGNAAEHPTASVHPTHQSSALRPNLRETLRKIAAGGMPAQGAVRHSPQILPPGASFTTHTHTSAYGARSFMLYIPAAKTEAPMPLIVMLHGCTQSPEDFAAGTGMNALAETFGCIIAYPAQSTGANPNKCWNWFKPGDQTRNGGEPALIAGITTAILESHPVNPSRVYIAGLSAGGAAALIVASAYPEIFSAVGVHSGRAIGAAGDAASAFGAMRTGASGQAQVCAIPTLVLHGTADSTVHPENGAAVVAQALRGRHGLKTTIRHGKSVGGRPFKQTLYSQTDGRVMCEYWEITGAGHAWAGGSAAGSYTDPSGPDASAEILRFFLGHQRR